MSKTTKIIALSGIDGSGKTTLSIWLMNYLEKNGYKVAVIHKDFSFYYYLKHKCLDENSTRVGMAFDYIKSVHDLVFQHKYDFIICDRCALCYVSYGEKYGCTCIDLIVSIFKSIIQPDIVFFIDVDIDTAVKRIKMRNKKIKENENYHFLLEVSELYKKNITKYFGDTVIVNGNDKTFYSEIIEKINLLIN